MLFQILFFETLSNIFEFPRNVRRSSVTKVIAGINGWAQRQLEILGLSSGKS